MVNCGISRWDNPDEINAKLKELTSQPIWEVDDDYYNNVILPYYDEKCKSSKAVFEESQKHIPGGVQHILAFNKPFPMCMEKANGAYLYDKDGNRYIDFLQAAVFTPPSQIRRKSSTMRWVALKKYSAMSRKRIKGC